MATHSVNVLAMLATQAMEQFLNCHDLMSQNLCPGGNAVILLDAAEFQTKANVFQLSFLAYQGAADP